MNLNGNFSQVAGRKPAGSVGNGRQWQWRRREQPQTQQAPTPRRECGGEAGHCATRTRIDLRAEITGGLALAGHSQRAWVRAAGTGKGPRSARTIRIAASGAELRAKRARRQPHVDSRLGRCSAPAGQDSGRPEAGADGDFVLSPNHGRTRGCSRVGSTVSPGPIGCGPERLWPYQDKSLGQGE